jgi:hypothetical protein
MTKPIETLELSETFRVAAYPDYDASGPFDWGTVFVQTLRAADRLSNLTSDDGHARPIAEIIENNPYRSFDGYTRERLDNRDKWNRDAITKHLTRAGFDCRFLDLRGYSQGEWHDIVIYAAAGDITEWAGFEREIEAWYRGEVYWLAFERLETYTNENGKTITQWETVDSIGEVYLLDGLTREIAAEHFNLDPATVAA